MDRRRSLLRRRAGTPRLKARTRTAEEELEWRILSYMSDFGDPRRAYDLAAEFAAAPYPINIESNKALNAEEKASSETELLAACRDLRVPFRVVHGARDPRPVWALEPMVAALPRAELIVIDGAGHLPWLEEPDAFGEAVRGFVGRFAQ